MTHNSFACFWNRVVTPLFVSGSASQGVVPPFDDLEPEEKTVLLAYVYEQHNLDDFRKWVRANRSNPEHAHGINLWALRWSRDPYELVCAPTPGPVFSLILVTIPFLLAILGTFTAYAALLGFRQMLA